MKKNRLGIMISIAVLIVGYIVNYYFNPYAKHFRWLGKEIPLYKPLTKEEALHHVIKNCFRERGSVYITLNDGSKIGIGVSRNGLYERSFVGDFLQVGDSLHKKPSNDTFYVYRDDANYYFILGKIINEN